MSIIKNKKIRIRIIIFSIITILIIGMIIFIPKIQKMIEDAKWKKGIYILPTSQYHAFGIDENTTITQLNFVCVKESEETFLSFLNEYHFILSNDAGDELELVFQETFQFFMQHQSVTLVEEGEHYQHYAISFLVELSAREDREFDSISIYETETEKESLEIGRIIYEFFDYPKTISSLNAVPDTVHGSDFGLGLNYSVRDVSDYTIDSVIVRLTDAVSGSEELNNSELYAFPVNAVCSGDTCSIEYIPFFTTTNAFLTYTLKPLTKYLVNDVEHYDTYNLPIIYFRVLEDDKYFEVSDTFTNLLDSSN